MKTKQASKQWIFVSMALILVALGHLMPVPAGWTRSALQVSSLFLATLLLWMTVSISWPSLFCLCGLCLVNGIKSDFVWQQSFGASTFAFLVFTFLCTYALSTTSLVQRVALFFIRNPWAKRGPDGFFISYFLSILFLGCFLSPTVLFLLYLPIHEAICEVLSLKKGSPWGACLMMGLAFTCAIASGMTPIAHVFSIMAMGFYQAISGQAISYACYMGFGITVGLLTFCGMLLLFKIFLRGNRKALAASLTAQEAEALEQALKKGARPIEKREKSIWLILLMVLALWLLPSFLAPVWPAFTVKMKALGPAFPPLLGVVLLLLVRVEGEALLPFEAAFQKGVAWPAVMMAAATLALGSAITHPQVGGMKLLQSALVGQLQGLPAGALIAFFTIWAGLQTNLSSNMVTVTVVSSAALPLVVAGQGGINPAALACVIGLMGSFSFATPPAHPNIALAGASGWTSARQVFFFGSLLLLIAVLVVLLIGYPLANALL